MSKEFENFKNILGQKQNELEIQARTAQKAQEDEAARKQAEARQKQIESDQRATKNRRIFEDAGVVKLFEEIRDSGLLKISTVPVYEKWEEVKTPKYEKNFLGGKKIIGYYEYKQGVNKITDFTPAIIEWGEENRSIRLLFDEQYVGSSGDDDRYGYDHIEYSDITLVILDNETIGGSKKGFNGYNATEREKREIKDVSSYIAEEATFFLNNRPGAFRHW